MLQILTNSWKYIANIGLNESVSPQLARSVSITNRMLMIAFLILLGLFFVNFSQRGWSSFGGALLFGNLISAFVIYFLNKHQFYTIGRVIFSWMFTLYPFYTSISTKIVGDAALEEGQYFMPRLFILTAAIIPLFIFSLKERVGLGLGVLGSLVPLLFFDFIHNAIGIGYYQMGFNAEIYQTLNAITITIYIIFMSATFFFKRTNEKFEEENLELIDSLEKSNQELKIKNEEIEKQSKSLRTANYEVRLANKNLEEVVNHRTKKLLDQAVKLQMFSFKNSHELRAPLTNVMSTLQILRDNQSSSDTKKLLEILEESCDNLDKIVHEINEILIVEAQEETIPPDHSS